MAHLKEWIEYKFKELSLVVRNETDKAIVQEVWGQKVYGENFNPGDRIIDIGAQIGAFSLFAASKGAFVAAFEPDRENYAALLENLARNDAGGQIRAYDKAVWSRNGVLSLYDSCSDNLGAHSVVFARNPEKKTEVECITLEGALAINGWNEAEFLKMDCEGAEVEIIKSRAIGRLKAFAMEFHGCFYNKEIYDATIERLAKYFYVRGYWHEVISYIHGQKKT